MGGNEIRDKLTKLLRHAESATKIGSFEEAAAFMGKVHQLLTEHGLSMQEIDVTNVKKDRKVGELNFNPTDYGIPFKRQIQPWYLSLAGTVAQAHYCDAIGFRGSNALVFIGLPENRDVATYMFVFLTKTIETLADKAYVDFFYKCRDALQRETKGCTALMVVSHEAIEEYNREHLPKTVDQHISQKAANQHGYAKGREAGNNVSLTANALRGGDDYTVPSNRRLS